MCEIMKIMPAVSLRGMVILPGMIIHFDISKPHSIHAVEEAMQKDEKIFLITLKNGDADEPVQEDFPAGWKRPIPSQDQENGVFHGR